MSSVARCATPRTGSSLWTWSTWAASGWTFCPCWSTLGRTVRPPCTRAHLHRKSSPWCTKSEVRGVSSRPISLTSSIAGIFSVLWSSPFWWMSGWMCGNPWLCFWVLKTCSLCGNRAVLQRQRAHPERSFLSSAEWCCWRDGWSDAGREVHFKPVRKIYAGLFAVAPKRNWSRSVVILHRLREEN